MLPRSPMTKHHADAIEKAIRQGKVMRSWLYGCTPDDKYDAAAKITTPNAFRIYCEANPEWAKKIKARLQANRYNHRVRKGAGNRRKTTCPKGHPYDGTYMKHGKPQRRCMVCFHAQAKLRYETAKQKKDDPQFQLRNLMRADGTKNKIKVSTLDRMQTNE